MGNRKHIDIGIILSVTFANTVLLTELSELFPSSSSSSLSFTWCHSYYVGERDTMLEKEERERKREGQEEGGGRRT